MEFHELLRGGGGGGLSNEAAAVARLVLQGSYAAGVQPWAVVLAVLLCDTHALAGMPGLCSHCLPIESWPFSCAARLLLRVYPGVCSHRLPIDSPVDHLSDSNVGKLAFYCFKANLTEGPG